MFVNVRISVSLFECMVNDIHSKFYLSCSFIYIERLSMCLVVSFCFVFMRYVLYKRRALMCISDTIVGFWSFVTIILLMILIPFENGF